MRSSTPPTVDFRESGEGAARAAAWIMTAVLLWTMSSAVEAQLAPEWQVPVANMDAGEAAPAERVVQQDLLLAGNYLVGKGVEKDPAQAAYWFRKAADLGDPGAQNELGYLYTWGMGVGRDEAQAFRWFARAAGSGYPPAKLNLAVMYLKGVGVAQDAEMGRQLLTELAGKGNGRAENYLGIMYFIGYGVTEDRAAAEEWFRKAAQAKNPEGEYQMGALYFDTEGHERDYGKAAEYLRRSARAGYVPAMHALGVLLESHAEVKQKRENEGEFWLERSAAAGTWQSSAMLGRLARAGRGMPQDMGAAFRWFTIAAKQGGPEAALGVAANLDACGKALTAEQQGEEVEAAESWLQDHQHRDLFAFGDAHSEFAMGEVYAPWDGQTVTVSANGSAGR